MRKLTRRVVTAIAVAATTVALTAVPASAAATWTITPGGGFTGINTDPVQLVNSSTGATVVCDKSTIAGTLGSGGLPGSNLGVLTSITFSTPTNPNGWCAATGGILVAITPTGLPWTFDATSYDPATGVTTGALEGIGLTLHSSEECDATITGLGGAPGTMSFTYTNPSSLLAIGGNNLEVESVDADCDPGLINAGDTITLAAQYLITPTQTITSP